MRMSRMTRAYWTKGSPQFFWCYTSKKFGGSSVVPTMDNLFSFQALDTRYHLKCNILLDIQEIYISHERGGNQRDSLSPIAVCTFPEIDEKMLIEKSFGNEYILEVLRTQFHLNILESLLLLCEDVNASGLMINISPHNPNPIEIYQNLIVSQNQVFTENGEQTQVLVSIDVDTYDQLIDCIEKHIYRQVFEEIAFEWVAK